MKHKKFGRPRISREDLRDKRVVAFMTRAEVKQLEALARKERSSLSSLCHQILADHLQNSQPGTIKKH
jgi:hypothetical protein